MKTKTEKVVCNCGDFLEISSPTTCPNCLRENYPSDLIREMIRELDTQATELRIRSGKLQAVLMYRERLRTSTTTKGQVVLYTPETFFRNVHGTPRSLQPRREREGRPVARVSVDLGDMPD